MFDTYAQIFEKRANEYHHAMRAYPDAREAEFQAILDPIRDASPGLLCDMPSGGGYLARYLPVGMDYLAVDPATDFFVEWPKSLPRVLAEITRVPLGDDSVDYVVSLAGLHHEPSLANVFAEMRRLLRPGGRLVLADVAIGTAPAIFLNGFVNEHCPLGHEGRFLDGQTAPTLESAGFAVVEDRQIEVPWTFDNLEDAGEFCRHLFGMTTLGAGDVAAALEREIGFDMVEGRRSLRWTLRHIVAGAG